MPTSKKAIKRAFHLNEAPDNGDKIEGCLVLLFCHPSKIPKTLDPENRLGAKSVGTVVASYLSFLGFSSPDSEGTRRLDHELAYLLLRRWALGICRDGSAWWRREFVMSLELEFWHWEMASHGEDGIQVWITSSVSVSLCVSPCLQHEYLQRLPHSQKLNIGWCLDVRGISWSPQGTSISDFATNCGSHGRMMQFEHNCKP